MALQIQLDKAAWEGLEEGFRGLYEEKDGAYRLAIEGLEDTSGLKSALEKERQAVKDAAKRLKTWEDLGLSPEEISERLRSGEKKEEPEKKKSPSQEQFESLSNKMGDHRLISELQKKIDALEKDRASEKREALIKEHLGEYRREQRDFMAGMVKGDTPDELLASIEAVKKAFPVVAGAVGAPGGNPGRMKPTTENVGEFGKAKAKQKGSEQINAEEFKRL